MPVDIWYRLKWWQRIDWPTLLLVVAMFVTAVSLFLAAS